MVDVVGTDAHDSRPEQSEESNERRVACREEPVGHVRLFEAEPCKSRLERGELRRAIHRPKGRRASTIDARLGCRGVMRVDGSASTSAPSRRIAAVARRGSAPHWTQRTRRRRRPSKRATGWSEHLTR